MFSEDELKCSENHAILIMGKRQGTKKENKQLYGRVAMGAMLWYSSPEPKPYIIFLASDTHGSDNRPDSQVVKTILIKKFEIPPDYLIMRNHSNCTLLEVRAARVLKRVYRLNNIFVLTHLYHANRTQRYFDELLSKATVLPVHPDILPEISFPWEYSDLLPEMIKMVADSQPTLLDKIRENIVEWLLNLAHTFDPRGKIERSLAKLLRPTAYK